MTIRWKLIAAVSALVLAGCTQPKSKEAVSSDTSTSKAHAGAAHAHGEHAGAEHPGSEHPGSEHPGSEHPGVVAEATSDGATLCGSVRLATDLADRFKPGTVLFVFAKHKPGGGPPLAVMRAEPKEFPVAFCLSQKNTMVPGMTFEGNVYVTARLDADGSAGSGPGDLEGVTAEPVEVGTQDLVLTIDTAK